MLFFLLKKIFLLRLEYFSFGFRKILLKLFYKRILLRIVLYIFE